MTTTRGQLFAAREGHSQRWVLGIVLFHGTQDGICCAVLVRSTLVDSCSHITWSISLGCSLFVCMFGLWVCTSHSHSTMPTTLPSWLTPQFGDVGLMSWEIVMLPMLV